MSFRKKEVQDNNSVKIYQDPSAGGWEFFIGDQTKILGVWVTIVSKGPNYIEVRRIYD